MNALQTLAVIIYVTLLSLVFVVVVAVVDYWINFRSKGNKHVKVWKKYQSCKQCKSNTGSIQ